MPQLITTYDGKGVRRMLDATAALASPGKIERSLHEGVRAAGDKIRTVVRRRLHAQMGTKKYGTIVKATRSYIPGRLMYGIDGQGKGLYIDEFPVRAGKREAKRFDPREQWRRQPRDAHGRFGKLPKTWADELDGPGGVSASPWRVVHKFKRSYVDGEGVYRARRPGKKGKGRKLYGASAAKELVKGETRSTFEREAPREMDLQIGKRLARLLP